MSGDLIRRKDAIRALEELDMLKETRITPGMSPENFVTRLFLEAESMIESLPSVEPERKKGQWIEYPDCLGYDGAYSDDHIVCSECEHVFSILDNCTEEFDFCPHCGSYNGDMRGSDE